MKTLLLAEDYPLLRRLARAIFPAERYALVEATDGDEAWTLLHQHHPAVAVLDVQMPGRTGLELTEAIKRDPDLAATKIILLTAKSDPTDIRAGLAAGADHYLTKPFSPLELLHLVEEAFCAAGAPPGDC